MKLLIIQTLLTLVAAKPGLLRVPKVYNAVITSNQNLSPSRAFPVIQPVVHRTAIGYVPPLYYTQVAPQFAGPEVVHSAEHAARPLSSAEDEIQAQSSPSVNVELSKKKKDRGKDKEETTERNLTDDDVAGARTDSKKKSDEDVPLSFYPNYHSLYYDPYFYTYSGFNPHVVPGTYYVDYQPYGALEPIPASAPENAESGHLLPGYHEEKKGKAQDDKEKIPDVPPPPLPTAVPKSS